MRRVTRIPLVLVAGVGIVVLLSGCAGTGHTNPATDVTATSATLNATTTYTGHGTWWFEYSTDGFENYQETPHRSYGTPGSCPSNQEIPISPTEQVDGLEPSTHYQFRLVGTNCTSPNTRFVYDSAQQNPSAPNWGSFDTFQSTLPRVKRSTTLQYDSVPIFDPLEPGKNPQTGHDYVAQDFYRSIFSVCTPVRAGDLIDVRAALQAANPNSFSAELTTAIVAADSPTAVNGTVIALRMGTNLRAGIPIRAEDRSGFEIAPQDGTRCYNLVAASASYDSRGHRLSLWPTGHLQLANLGQGLTENHHDCSDEVAGCDYETYLPLGTTPEDAEDIVGNSVCRSGLEQGDIVDLRSVFAVRNDSGANRSLKTWIVRRNDGVTVASSTSVTASHTNQSHHFNGERRAIDVVPSAGDWCYDLHLSSWGVGEWPLALELSYFRFFLSVIGKEGMPPTGTGIEVISSDTLRSPHVYILNTPPWMFGYIPYSECQPFNAGDVVDIRARYRLYNPQTYAADAYSYLVRGSSPPAPYSDDQTGAVVSPQLAQPVPPGWNHGMERSGFDVIPSSGTWCYSLVLTGRSPAAASNQSLTVAPDGQIDLLVHRAMSGGS